MKTAHPMTMKELAERKAFTPRPALVRATLIRQIEEMLDDLGHPPLVDRIFPNGWRNADDAALANLYDLCGRTYAARASQEPTQ